MPSICSVLDTYNNFFMKTLICIGNIGRQSAPDRLSSYTLCGVPRLSVPARLFTQIASQEMFLYRGPLQGELMFPFRTTSSILHPACCAWQVLRLIASCLPVGWEGKEQLCYCLCCPLCPVDDSYSRKGIGQL